MDAEVPGRKECVGSTGRLGGMLSSPAGHEEERGAGFVPTHHQETKVPRMAIFRPNTCRILSWQRCSEHFSNMT